MSENDGRGNEAAGQGGDVPPAAPPDGPSPYGYGTPMPPVGYELRQPAGPAPTQVVTAVRLMLANAALQVISLILSIAFRDRIIDSFVRHSKTTVDAATLRASARSSVGVSIGISLVIIVLYLLLAMQVRKGKNWARITTIVFAALGVLAILSVLSPATIGVMKVVGLALFVVNVGIIVLLTRRPSSHYFKRVPTGY